MLLRRVLMAAVFLTAAYANLVLAQAEQPNSFNENQSSVSISNNSGGNIAAFAMDAADYRRAGTLVQFNGRCDSACTLFLGLPAHQTCINHGAFFRFHAPSGVSLRSERIAQAFLLRKYPGWVRTWIARNNGLTHNLITMEYGYASKFIRTCGSVASR